MNITYTNLEKHYRFSQIINHCLMTLFLSLYLFFRFPSCSDPVSYRGIYDLKPCKLQCRRQSQLSLPSTMLEVGQGALDSDWIESKPTEAQSCNYTWTDGLAGGLAFLNPSFPQTYYLQRSRISPPSKHCCTQIIVHSKCEAGGMGLQLHSCVTMEPWVPSLKWPSYYALHGSPSSSRMSNNVSRSRLFIAVLLYTTHLLGIEWKTLTFSKI